MSGVTGILLSYGADSTPIATFTMTNVDIITFEVTANPTGKYTISDSNLVGNSPILLNPPSGVPYYGEPSAVIEEQDDIVAYPLAPDPDYSGVFPSPDYAFYDDIDWGSDYPIWFAYGPSFIRGQVMFDFFAAATGWNTQTVFSGTVAIYPYDWEFNAPDTTVQVTPVNGGVVERSSYASEILVVPGGTAGTPYIYANTNYLFEDAFFNVYKYATFVDYIYVVATKTFFGTIRYETIPT